ncbi:MAG: pirin family protein [Piscinibacter sp.]|uniref:pirin family protein n=1 Tax=Piscinibacter sp. TaxID=1903157 RepID=UPI001B6756AB|nr:pirin family protein [Piscinibacter sp.]MBP5990129.1 pirin family protein [Piscinibacter sp.]MBP6027478.1 pirin family protein [Piscinibacter sp.]
MNPPAPRRIEARPSEVGGIVLRRAVPSRALRSVGAWCFLDHAGPARFAPGQGMHVGPHPHIGLQTFTWMIEGELMHRDSLGSEQLIRAGQVNLMTAGRGIVHSEDQVGDGGALHAAQMWIALPDAERDRAPAFQHYPELPVIERDGVTITLLVGEVLGERSKVEVFTPLVGLDLATHREAQTTLPLASDFEHAVLVLRGSATVAGEALQPGTLLDLGRGRSSVAMQLAADSQLLLLGGEPFDPPPLLWWNFVARTQAEIEQALADWNSGSARFGAVAGAGSARLLAPPLAGLRLKAGR